MNFEFMILASSYNDGLTYLLYIREKGVNFISDIQCFTCYLFSMIIL